MTEEQVERRVERMTDHLDRLLMTGVLNQDDYDKAMRSLNRWANVQADRAAIYDRVRRRYEAQS